MSIPDIWGFVRIWRDGVVDENVGAHIPKRHLIFVIGNHDIELSLPVVEDSIRRRLTGNNGDAWSRISFASHGGGFACQVGHARVFCSHGNELDPWNWVDYSALGQLANAINAGRTINPAQWKPNAGTRLVVDAMNQIKRRFPFVDLLKPEVAAVTSVLMTLDRELLKSVDLSDAIPILRDKRQGSRATSELLGAYAAQIHSLGSTKDSPEELASELLGSSLGQAVDSRWKSQNMSEDEFLLDAEGADGGVDVDNLATDNGLETLGAWDMVAGWVGLVPRQEGLRRALKDWLEADQTFAISDPEDELFRRMKDRVADTVDFVVTGHTHQPRAMSYDGGCHYYNCGTWIRRLRLTPQILDNEKAFEKELWPVLLAGRMNALDTATIPGPDDHDVPLLLDQTNAVRIVSNGDKVIGDLLRVTDAKKGSVGLDLEEGTTSFPAR